MEPDEPKLLGECNILSLTKSRDEQSFLFQFVDVLEPKNPLVLANPNECSLQWTDSKEGKMDRYYVPEVSEAIFVRSLRKQRQNGVDRSKIVPRFWPTRPGRINKTVNEGCTGKNEVCTDENTEYLRVDCLQSMKSVLEPQLVSIELDSSSFGPSQREVIHVKKHKNNGEDVSLYTFDAIAPISLLFQYKLKGYRVPFEKYLKNETNVATFRENLSNSLLQKLFNWPEAEAFLPRLNSNASDLDGRFSVDVHFKRQVLIPDHTECEIASYIDWITLPNPTNATVKFSIAPVSKFKKFWTNSRILSFLKQRNIDRSQLREENDKLTFKFDAELFAKFFIDAKVDDPICEKS